MTAKTKAPRRRARPEFIQIGPRVSRQHPAMIRKLRRRLGLESEAAVIRRAIDELYARTFPA